jgi:hypothetical protein
VGAADKSGHYHYFWPVRGGYVRFTDNGNGTVTDNDSGLVWLKDAFCSDINDGGSGLNWDDAMAAAAGLNSGECGLTDGSSPEDWRLPTKEEWEAFVCTGYTNPAVCNTVGDDQWSEGDPFNNVQSYYYWSSTETDSDTAWYVYLYNGYMPYSLKSYYYYVWPVRDP